MLNTHLKRIVIITIILNLNSCAFGGNGWIGQQFVEIASK